MRKDATTGAGWRQRFGAWLQGWRPVPLRVDGAERARAVGGALLGLLWTAALARWLSPWPELPWLVAPLGASAVLVFALPASPLAQPWAVVVGNTVSAGVGVAALHLGGPTELMAALAGGGALALMIALRCLHPPGGAVALLMVLSGLSDGRAVWAPVALNALLMVAAGMIYNPLTGRRYPHPADAAAAAAPAAPAFAFTAADLDAALARYNQVLDVPRDDLRELLESAEVEAYQRRMRTLRARDVMSADPRAVQFGTPLGEAWQLMRREHIKALPVVDRYRHLVGIVTQADFLRHARIDHPEGLAGLDARLKQLLTPSSALHSDRPEVVGQIMTRSVRVADAERALGDLVAQFSVNGHHHLPVVGPNNRLLGMVTQQDVVVALARPPA